MKNAVEDVIISDNYVRSSASDNEVDRTTLSLEVIDITHENGVLVAKFPPHCSHRSQPLAVSVYGPFKRYCNAACHG